MGIHNATPDSFSDGIPELNETASVEHCLQMLDAGADIIDIGGESTRPGDSLLDVGTGSGILALGALRAGAARATALDVDPVACRTAADNAARNGLALALVCGTPAALAPGARFDTVVANELFVRLAPFVSRLGAHARRALVLSGFLERERDEVEAAVRACGLAVESRASESQSGDDWGALRAGHAAARHASSRSPSVSSKA